MAKRRGNQEGSIYKRGEKWRALVTVDGRRLSFTAQSQRECQKWIRDIQGQIDSGMTFKGSKIRLSSFMKTWLSTVSSSRKLNTIRNYSWVTNKRITPHIGRMYLSDLSTENIQGFYDSLIESGLSRHAVHCTHKVLRVALNHAVKLGYIGRNPCAGTSPPRPEKSEMKFLDEAQVNELLRMAIAIGDRLYPLYHLAIHTGMRLSELLATKWSDIDLERRTLQINHQVLYLRGQGYKFTEPKTLSGRRTVILGKKMLGVLRDYQPQVEALKALAGEHWMELDLVFPSEVGTPLTPSNVRRDFRRLLKAADIPRIRFHDLRHTAASLMLNHNVPVLIASRRLGHSKASITMDVYGHLMPNKQEEAAQLLDTLVNLETEIAPKLHPIK